MFFVGNPSFVALRISVEAVLELLAKGATEQEILEDYAELEPDDIRAVLITVYRPDQKYWINWRTRRPKDATI